MKCMLENLHIRFTRNRLLIFPPKYAMIECIGKTEPSAVCGFTERELFMAKKQEYGSDSITMLKGPDKVR